jgi:hypothetical protein
MKGINAESGFVYETKGKVHPSQILIYDEKDNFFILTSI